MRRPATGSWWTKPRVASAILSIAAGLISVVPGLVAGAPFNAELSILTLTLAGLVWYTAFTYEAIEASDAREAAALRRSRAGLATGLLAELKSLEAAFRQVIHQKGRGPALDYFVHPVLENALGRLELFSPKTAGRVVAFAGAVSRTRQAAELSKGVAGTFLNQGLVNEATLAVRKIPDLAKTLAAEEGGTMPEEVDSDLVLPGGASLPVSPFGEFDHVLGWRARGPK